MIPITHECAQAFAHEWIDAWNAHDLERILSHYADDFEMTSPVIVSLMGEPSGVLKGKATVRAYWAKGLAAQPPLRFELLDVLAGVRSVTIYYRSIGRRVAAEVLEFNDRGEAVRGSAHYAVAKEDRSI